MERVKTPAMLSRALNTPGFIGLSFAHLLSSAETSFSEKALKTSKNEPKYLHQPSRDSYVSVIPITQFERGYLSLRFLFRSIMLTLNRPGFSESGTAGEGRISLFEDHDHEIW